MLFFLDESWQLTKNEKYKVGILAAVQIKSRTLFSVDGKQYPLNGFKVIKEKEAGDLFGSGRTE